jgi:imidazolonepropionase-like amidohydrolase
VIDAPRGRANSEVTVMLEGEHIAALGRGSKIKVPQGAQVIDATGKYLIPGLWDMHVHEWNKEVFFPLFVANGITGVRDMFSPLPPIKQWRAYGWKEHTPEFNAQAKRVFQKQLEVVGMMNRAGVRFISGTDTANPYVFPGFSLHDELALLVQAGLTPAEALRTATINPAKYFDMEKSLGTVEKGKMADLVLLDANPLTDINNTRKIAAVISGGRYLPNS